jgi:hypothetical protein
MNGSEDSSAQKAQIPPAQDSTKDLIKLLISLASGVIAISAAFIEKLSSGVGFPIVALYLAWISLLSSVFFGVKALSKLVHAQQTDANNWYDITLPPMRRCWFYFQAGVVLLVVYASITSGIRAWSPNADNDQRVVLNCDNSYHQRQPLIDTSHCIRATCMHPHTKRCDNDSSDSSHPR